MACNSSRLAYFLHGFVVFGVLCIPFWYFGSFWVWFSLSLLFGFVYGCVRYSLSSVGSFLRSS